MFVCACVTCTLDSLSDETPHEVGTVLTPVGASECMNLVKEAEKRRKFDVKGAFLKCTFVTEFTTNIKVPTDKIINCKIKSKNGIFAQVCTENKVRKIFM